MTTKPPTTLCPFRSINRPLADSIRELQGYCLGLDCELYDPESRGCVLGTTSIDVRDALVGIAGSLTSLLYSMNDVVHAIKDGYRGEVK